jgi:hypothetical protein
MAFSYRDVNAFLDKVLYDTSTGGVNDLAAAILVFRGLQNGAYAVVSVGSGQVISTSANGKTVTISVSAGLSQQDIFLLSTDAIKVLNAGGTQLSNRSIARF